METPQILFEKAAKALAEGGLSDAAALLRRLLAIQPGNPDALSLQGVIFAQSGQPGRAIDCFNEAMQGGGRTPDLLYNLGLALQEAGRADEAYHAYVACLLRDPDYFLALSELGNLLMARGMIEDAAAAYGRAVQLRPDYAIAQRNLGVAALRLGRQADAFAAFTACGLEQIDDPDMLRLVGQLALAIGRFDAAADAFSALLRHQPGDAEACNELGMALMRLARPRDALSSYERALTLSPNLAVAWLGKGAALEVLGQNDAADQSYREALRIRPDLLGAASNRLMALLYRPEIEPAAIAQAHRDWGHDYVRRLPRPTSAIPANRRRLDDRPLRVGYVSGDFRYHSVALFLSSIVNHHDPAAVTVFAYADGAIEDEMTHAMKAQVPFWRRIHDISDADVAARVRADAIDILVDLGGHTASGRLGVFASAPAGVQVSYLGYPASTGLPTIPWRIGDHITDPPGDGPDDVARLDRCFLAITRMSEVDPPNSAPMLRRGQVTFGCFNNIKKLNQRVAAVWAELLAATPGSRLLLKSYDLLDAPVRERVTDMLMSAGIPAKAIEIYPWRRIHRDHMAAYGEIDLALDPFPYNGTATTVEALYAGVPVVTLLGDRHAARVGASLLSAIGEAGWIAPDLSAYIACARELVLDGEELSRVRLGLRDQLLRSAIGDGLGLTRALEQLYRRLVEA